METFEFRVGADEGLRPDEVAFLFQLLRFLVRKNPETRFSIHDLERHRAEKQDMDGLVLMDGGHKESRVQASH